MKKQQSKIEDVLSTVIAFLLSCVITTAIWFVRFVVWPVLRFCAKATWNGIRRLLTKAKVVKEPEAVKQLPTPACFQGAPNLAQAKSIRF